jgi:hypothetical protein
MQSGKCTLFLVQSPVMWFVLDVNLITIQIYSVVIKTIMPNMRGCSSYLLLSVGVKDFIHYDGSGVSHEYAPCEFSYCFIMVYMSLLTTDIISTKKERADKIYAKWKMHTFLSSITCYVICSNFLQSLDS